MATTSTSIAGFAIPGRMVAGSIGDDTPTSTPTPTPTGTAPLVIPCGDVFFADSNFFEVA